MDIKKIVSLSMLVAISIVLSIIESFIPIFSGMFVGFKLGLANIIILYVLYKYSFFDAIEVSLIRVLVVGILRTGLFSLTFIFSLSGAIFSLIMMQVVKKTKLSIIGVSVIGSLFHITGQLLIASFIIKMNLVYYLPLLLVFSVVSGIIVGIISKELIEKV